MRRAAEQRDAADQGRSDAFGSIIVGPAIVNQGKVVRPSQLIASVRRTWGSGRGSWRTLRGIGGYKEHGRS